MIPRKHTYYFVLLLCIVLCNLTAYGQGICPSSALAPVFSQTFGQSASTSSKSNVPSGFITNYAFQSSGALNDGSYIVTPRVQNSGRNDWAQGNDHTGNSNGNMFLVNAGTGASIFFSQQVDNLCPGSTYNFSAWLANVNTTSHTIPICGTGYVYPNVTFNIKNTSGVILASYSTGNIPLTVNRSVVPNWQQYGFSFSLPSGTTSLVLEMIDAYGGQPQCGNDLAIDDILFTACTPSATASFSTPSTICSGTSTTIQASIINNPFTNPAYQWQKSTDGGASWSNIGTPGTNASVYSMNNVSSVDQAMYRVLVGPDVASLSTSTCITASSGISLTVIPSPSTAVNTTSPICSGNAINLTSTTTGGVSPYSYSWSGPNSFTSTVANPIINNSTATNSGTYTLIATGSNGCSATASTSVTVNTTPGVNAIAGPKGGCSGTNITLTNSTAGGVWSSSNTAVATVNQSGVVSLLTGGTTTITYTVTTNGCSASVTKEITVASVVLGADLMECNNGVRSYSNLVSNPYYVAYGNTNPGNTYLWTFTNNTTGLVETDIYKSGKTNASDYPSIQLQNGNVYSVSIQYTTNDITCTATQTLYKSIELTGSIASAQDTTVCFNASNIPLRGQVSIVANSLNWYTLNGSGSFSSTNTLNTTYTPSAADKANGVVYIVFAASTTLNATGNCGSSNVSDTMALRILPNNIGTSSVQNICSNSLFQHTPSSAISGSTFTWTSSVISGTGSGNAASGSGAISNTLINNSNSTDYVVEYSITPQYNGCSASPYTVRVNVKPEPELTVTNNTNNTCTGTATNIILNSTISGTQYTWTSSLLTGIANGNTNNPTPSLGNTITDVLTNNSNNTATIRYTISGVTPDGCSSKIATEVVVYPTPSTADAGTDQNLCNATSTALNATAPASGTGIWSFISGPTTPSFTNTNLPTTTVSGLTVGTYTFRWTVSNGICASSQDDVTIVINALTVAGTLTPNLTVCAPLNSGTLTLSGHTGNIIHWEYSVNGGGSWTTSNITSTTYTFNDLNTTTQYRATVKNGACAIEISNMATVTVQQPPSAANAGPDETINGISSATLAANNPTSGTGTWSQISGPNTATFSNINQHNTSVSGLVVGTYTFRWTISNGVCGSTLDEMIITVEPATVAGIISADATVCAAGGNGATLTLSGYTGNILQWEFSTNNGSTWTIIANTTNQYTYTNLTTTTIYRALVKSGIGASVYSSIATVTVIQAPTIANAGPDQTINGVSSTTLAANNPTTGTGAWSQISGPNSATFANVNQYNTNVTGLTVGTYTFRWTTSNGICASSSDDITIIVEPATVAGTISADATVCAAGGNDATLTLSGYTGNILQWEFSTNNGSTWTIIANTTDQYTYSNLNTTTLYRALVQSGIGIPTYSSIATITVMQVPTTANAGADQTLCNQSIASLLANNPTSGNGIWSFVSGPSAVSFANSATYNTSVTGLTTGTYELKWTISNGVCPSSEDNVLITVVPPTVPGTLSADAVVCATANNGTLTLNGYTGSIVQSEYSINNGSSWSIIPGSAASNTINYNNLSTTTLYRTLVKNSVCNSEYSNTVTITVLQAVTTANAGADQTLCNQNITSLLANNPTSGNGIWSFVSGPSAVSFANSATYNTSVTGLITGTYELKWTISNGVCSSSEDNVLITVVPPTVPGTLSADAVVCATANGGTLTLNGYVGSIVQSEYSITNGSTWNIIPGSTASNTINYNNLSTTTLYRTLVKNSVCNSEYSNTVTITVLQAVTTANAGADQTVCSVNAVTLAGNQPSSGTGMWTQVSGPNTANFINASAYNTTVDGLIAGTYQFRWTISNGVCSNSSDDVTIHIDPSTIAGNVLGSTTVCADNNSGTLLLTAHRGAIIQWASSIDNGNNWTIIANNTNSISYSNLNTTTAYRAQVKSGVCGAAYSTMATIQVDAITIPGTLSGSATVCNGNNSGVITLNGNNGNIVRWEYSTNNGSTWNDIANTSNSYSYTNLTQATIFRVLVKNGVCSNGYSNQVNISIDPVTIPGTTSGTTTVCYGNNTGNILLTGKNGNVQYWEYSEDGGISWTVINQQTTVLSYNNLTKTTSYRASVRSGVCSPAYSSTTVITVTPLSVGGTVSSNSTVCSGNNTGSLSLSGHTGSVIGWQYSTDGGNIWNDITHTSTSYTYSNITVTTQYRAVVQNGICSQVFSNPAIITVDQPTNPGVTSGAITSCSGNNNGSIQLNGNNGVVIRWETSTDNGNSWINVSNNTNTYNYSNLITTTQFKALVQNGTCNAAYTNITTIQIVPAIINTINTTSYIVCDGQSVTVNAPAPTGGNGTYTYQWQMSIDGINWTNITDAINASYNFIPVHEQTLLRRVVTSVPCASTSNTVTVIKQAALGNNTLTTSIEICTGTTAQIIGSDPTGGDGTYFYQWETSTDGGNTWSTISGDTQKDFTTPVLTANQLFRRIVTTQLCTGAQSNTSNIATIIVRPDANAIVSIATNTGCTPFSVTAANVQATHNAATNNNYEWFVNGVSIGTGINFPGYTLPLNQNQATIRLTANSLYNCKTSTAEVIVYGSHPANPSFTISDTLGCGPMNVTINNTTPSIGNYTYSWYVDQTLISSSQQLGNLVLQRSISGLDTVYTLTLRASSPLCGTFSISKSIIVRSKPKAQFMATPAIGCSPVNITFQNQSIGNNTIYQYRFGDGKDTLLNSLSTVTHTYTTNRLVTLSSVLLASNECGVDSMTRPVIIRPDNIIPQLLLSDSSLCGPGTIRFSNTTTGALRFTWSFGDGTTLATTDTGTISHQYQQPGTYTFSLITDNDCSITTVTRTIRVHTAPIAAFSVNAPDFCVGDSIHIHNQSSSSNIFKWSFSNGSSSMLMNPVVAYQNAGIINATLIAGTIYAPDSTACYDTITAPIRIVAIRKGSMEVNSLTGVCLPHQVNVKSLNVPAASVVWNWGDGKSTNGDTATYFYHKNGNYQLTMLATSNGGCQFRDTATIAVNSPTGNIHIQSTTICLGQSAVFTTQITDDQRNSGDSVIWHTGDGNVIKRLPGSFTYQYQQAGVYYPQAFLMKANGCMIPLLTNDSVRVDQVVAKFGLSAVFECGTTHYKFMDSSKAFFGLRSWKWSLDGKDSSNERIKVANFTQRGTHNAALEVESNTGCTANFQASFDVQVFQYPIANINAMAEACKTDLIQLKSNVSSQDSVVMRFWTLGNGANAKDSVVNALYTSEGKYNVKLVVATINQCYDSVFKAVTVHPLPKITIDQNKIVCRGDSVTIRANGASRFIWKDQNENILCTNCTEIKVKPNNSIGYQVIGYNEFGCSEIKSTNVKVINPLKMVASPGDTLCIGDSKTLFATGAASYSWLPANGLNATNSASATIKPTETTSYKVVGKDAFNCFTDTATIKVVVGRPTPISLGRDTTITSGINYQLNVQSTNNDIVKWRWSGSTGISCITCPTPIVKLRDDACISCTVVNRYGCVSTDTVCIKTICPTTEVFVPNAFTPDGDGINDKLIVQGKGIRLIKSFRIFNRWGEVVFEKTNFNPGDPAYGWDGKIRGNNASPDVYVYVCEVICEKGLPSIFKGNTAILK